MGKINNFALMRSLFMLFLILLILGCKSDENISVTEADKNILGIEDYAEIVRHPISLDSSIDTSEWSEIQFTTKESKFDTVVSGAIVRKSFQFVNSGSKPLYILDTRVSCGCTVAAFNDEAIAPGETGTIEVEFNTFGKQGDQDKSIIVLSNSHPNEDRLSIRGYVQTKKKDI